MNPNNRWELVNFVIKWTLENAKHLEAGESYWIEKATDDCMLDISGGQDESETKDGEFGL